MTTEPLWKWWWATNEDSGYYGPFETRQDAIDAAVADGSCERIADEPDDRPDVIPLLPVEHVVFICEAYQSPVRLDLMFDVDRWFEDLDDTLYDLGNPDAGEGVMDQVGKTARFRLQEAVRNAIAAWHDDPVEPVRIIPWAFTSSRKNEVVRVPADDA
jgi:hypothetical protein